MTKALIYKIIPTVILSHISKMKAIRSRPETGIERRSIFAYAACCREQLPLSAIKGCCSVIPYISAKNTHIDISQTQYGYLLINEIETSVLIYDYIIEQIMSLINLRYILFYASIYLPTIFGICRTMFLFCYSWVVVN